MLTEHKGLFLFGVIQVWFLILFLISFFFLISNVIEIKIELTYIVTFLLAFLLKLNKNIIDPNQPAHFPTYCDTSPNLASQPLSNLPENVI